MKCPVEVRFAYDDYVADEELGELNMNMTDCRSNLKKMWKRVLKKGALYKNSEFDQCAAKPRVLMNVIGHNAGRPPDDLKDIELECRVCDEKFDFIVMEQRTQIRLSFENSPTKCKVHRGHM